MSKREIQVQEIRQELSMNTLTAARRKDLKGMLKHSLSLLAMEQTT